MYRFIKNDDGIALIMVLVLLILVGGLTATLMAAGVFNIRFGVDEVDRTKAFYAADAGVEYTKNTLIKMIADNKVYLLDENDNLNNYLNQNEENYFDNDENYISIGESEFKIKLINNDDQTIEFESTGRFNENDRTKQKIKFSFNVDSFYEVAVLLNNPENLTKEDLTDWRGGQDGEFNYDSIGLLDLPDWWDFLDPYQEDSEKIDESYIKWDDTSKLVYDYIDFETTDLDQIRSTSDLEDIGSNKLFFSPKEEKVDIDTAEVWDSETKYSEDDIVIYPDEDGSYYVATQDIDKGVSPDESDYWDEINDDEDLIDLGLRGGITVENKIFIVNGSLDIGSTGGEGGGGLGNITFKNSLILVRNTVQIGGNTNLDGSLILAFNEDDKATDGEALTVTGANSINLEFLSSIEDDWFGVEDQLEGLEGAIADIADMRYWRQVR